MGSFANSVFSALLGWIQSIAQSVWNALSTAPKDSALSWAGRNWIPLAVALCAFGVICDFVVYLFRWRPLRVWRRFFRRGRAGEKAELKEKPEDSGDFREEPQAFEPAREPEAAYDPAPLKDEPVEPEKTSASGNRPEDRFGLREATQGLFNRWEEPEEGRRVDDSPYRRPPQEQREENPQERSPETTDIEQRLVRSGRKRRAARLVREFNETPDHSFPAASELISADEAYYRPVYPQKWQEQELKNDDGAV
ncbi:MAG: hypothetical protein IJI21_02490 [Clostridia bacterium]|nr:hypothetical protein [Clostridia bacterium]